MNELGLRSLHSKSATGVGESLVVAPKLAQNSSTSHILCTDLPYTLATHSYIFRFIPDSSSLAKRVSMGNHWSGPPANQNAPCSFPFYITLQGKGTSFRAHLNQCPKSLGIPIPEDWPRWSGCGGFFSICR